MVTFTIVQQIFIVISIGISLQGEKFPYADFALRSGRVHNSDVLTVDQKKPAWFGSDFESGLCFIQYITTLLTMDLLYSRNFANVCMQPFTQKTLMY